MEYTYKMRRAENGWIFTQIDDEGNREIVGVEDEDEVDSFVSFLWAIHEAFGPSTGKYSEKRVMIAALPGRCYEGELSEKMKETMEHVASLCRTDVSEE